MRFHGPQNLRRQWSDDDIFDVPKWTPPTSTEVVPPRVAARIGAGALVFGAVANLMTVIPIGRDMTTAPAGIGLSGVMMLVAVVSLFVPWDRLGARWTMACLVPPALAMMAVGNYTDPLPYVAGIYVVLVGAWVGISQKRMTTLILSPVMALAFYLPLSVGPFADRLLSSTVIITTVSVALGEVLGLFRVRLETSRRELVLSNQRRSEALTRNSIDVSMVLGADNRIRFVSPSVHTRFGYSPSELQEMPLDMFLRDKIRGIAPVDEESLVAGTFEGLGDTHRYELEFLNGDGQWIDIEAAVHNLGDDPDVDGIVVHIRDISERRALEMDLFHRAYHDDLTGLANRAAFRERVTGGLDSDHDLSVVFLDLDGFKVINDTLGHRQGDLMLKEIAARLVGAVPDGALVARLGGDEFAIALDLPVSDALVVADHVIEQISMPLELEAGTVAVGAKAGVAAGVAGMHADRIMENADLAMYEAKAIQDVDVVRFEPELREHLVARGRLQTALRTAVDEEEFVLHYQPQISLADGHWIGAESLIRWQRPGRGLVAPGEFISAAEESKMILEIGRWVLREACAEAVTWPVDPGRGSSIGVNVSSRQFSAEGFVDEVDQALEASGLEPGRLTIEVTESVLIHDFGMARRTMDDLSAMGVGLSLDDFGTGYSSLRYLLELPFSVVKIDQSFVRNATTEFSDYALLQTVNRLGHDLGLKTLIEGVETAEQARLVSSIGIDQAQGFHFCRPVEGAVVRSVLARGGPEGFIDSDVATAIGGVDQGWQSPL